MSKALVQQSAPSSLRQMLLRCVVLCCRQHPCTVWLVRWLQDNTHPAGSRVTCSWSAISMLLAGRAEKWPTPMVVVALEAPTVVGVCADEQLS